MEEKAVKMDKFGFQLYFIILYAIISFYCYIYLYTFITSIRLHKLKINMKINYLIYNDVRL